MFSKKNRLPTKEFNEVIKKGRPYKSDSFFIRAQKNNLGFMRTGVAVSKELARGVAQKNYYKRIARHLLKEAVEGFEQGYDIILILNRTAKEKNFQELKKEANELIRKISPPTDGKNK